MEHQEKRKGSFATLGIAALFIAICVVSLGSFLANAGAAETGAIYAETTPDNVTINDEVTAPDGLDVKVDTRGIDLPEGSVSAQYAAATAADIAERVYGKQPTGRVAVSLRDSATTMDEDYYEFQGLYWTVEAEVEGGSLTISVIADTGVDTMTNLYQGESNWQWFDDWGDGEGCAERFGTEAELVAQHEEIYAKYGENYGKSTLTDEERAIAYQPKRDGMLEFAASAASYPHGAAAVDIVNQAGLGNGANATAGRILMRGGSGRDFEHMTQWYVIEVTLDNGTYLYVDIDQGNMGLIGYERHVTDMPTLLYG
ncbi:MAG: hypothetical protein RR934_03970 [Gordonibacter sp.]|uniref:hypothetical protein n=1 Tax=Gordonibacter sp. TaxID=1968902 RepID=UPI00321F7943